MKVLGILGGMSWESTHYLYQLINRDVAARLGGLHSAELLLHSVDFDGIATLQRADDWAGAAQRLGDAGAGLRRAGAQALLIAANTMHRVADEVERASGLPVLHIIDATAAELRAAGVRRAGLLGTRYTMEMAFYRDRMAAQGIELLVPAAEGRDAVHACIYDELCQGRFTSDARAAMLAQAEALAAAGAEGVILGCTELGLLLPPADTPVPVPLFDSTAIHARFAVDWMLG
jgi:aspartate racemase